MSKNQEQEILDFKEKMHELLFFTDCARKFGAVQTTLVWKCIWLHCDKIFTSGYEDFQQLPHMMGGLKNAPIQSDASEALMKEILNIIDDVYRKNRNQKNAWEFKIPNPA